MLETLEFLFECVDGCPCFPVRKVSQRAVGTGMAGETYSKTENRWSPTHQISC